jgi:hypothetical protein
LLSSLAARHVLGQPAALLAGEQACPSCSQLHPSAWFVRPGREEPSTLAAQGTKLRATDGNYGAAHTEPVNVTPDPSPTPYPDLQERDTPLGSLAGTLAAQILIAHPTRVRSGYHAARKAVEV